MKTTYVIIIILLQLFACSRSNTSDKLNDKKNDNFVGIDQKVQGTNLEDAIIIDENNDETKQNELYIAKRKEITKMMNIFSCSGDSNFQDIVKKYNPLKITTEEVKNRHNDNQIDKKIKIQFIWGNVEVYNAGMEISKYIQAYMEINNKTGIKEIDDILDMNLDMLIAVFGDYDNRKEDLFILSDLSEESWTFIEAAIEDGKIKKITYSSVVD